VSDDWRLRVGLPGEEQAKELASRLAQFNQQHDLGGGFHDRVIVSRDGAEVFAYADTREQADAAARAIRSLADERRWEVSTELRRWHPTAEEWEDPDRPLPRTGAERAAERAEAMQSEREESAAHGYPEFEVRVRAPSRHDAQRLAERLRSEGIDCVQRWQFVVVGAPDEDTAAALAERIGREAPAGSQVLAEGSLGEAAGVAPLATPLGSPFAVFGGLGG
jgi:nucleotide-binding universal stress UspA family protein